MHALASREEIVIWENLANLASVAGMRYTFSGFPLKIRDGTGSPVRAIGIID